MYSIFHTSHCGSTLLSALLSKSIDSYAEPYWSHQLCNQKNPIEFINKNTKENSIVKYPSPYAYVMPQLNGKKIFLYNKLYHHLLKHQFNIVGLNFHKNVMVNYLHNKSKKFVYPEGQLIGEISYLWADRFYHALDSKDTIFIDCHDLFTNEKYVLEKICSFLEIEYKPININFHAKLSGCNHTNEPINIDNLENKVKKIQPYYPFNAELFSWCNEAYGSKAIISSFIY